MATSTLWAPIDLSDEQAREDAIEFARMVVSEAGESHLGHDLEWALQDDTIRQALAAFRLITDQGVLGFALLLRRSQPLHFRFGGITYYRRQLTRYNLSSAPLIVGVPEGSKVWQELASAFISTIKRQLPSSFEAIGIEGVSIDSPFHQLLHHDRNVNRTFLPMTQGNPLKRQTIELPATLDHYLEELGQTAREAILSTRKRLLRDFADDVEVTCFERESDVDVFLDHIASIAAKSGQGSLLENRPTLTKRLRFTARKAWLRSYVLFCSGRPVAMMIGYQCGGRLQATHVSVDPDYRQRSVGTALLCEIIDDLYARACRPELVVFAGDFDISKVSFVNRESSEVNVLLLSRTLKHTILAGAYQRLDGFANFAVSTAERIDVRRGLKRTIRKLSPS